jgi:flagellar protein FliL
MAGNRLEQAKPADEAAKPADKVAAAPAAKKGGNSWVPLVANIVLMPAVAYALTTFVLIPKIQGGKTDAAHEAAGDSHGDHKTGAKTKVTVPLGGKVLVNVAGTAGTRYLVATITLVGKKADLKEKVETSDPELRDAASSILGIKTISDLEKPGMRNIIRSELIAAFNDILGKESVTDIYLTEFAVQ